MSNLPKKCVVDTNVPMTANYSRDPEGTPRELVRCVLACVEAIEQVIKIGGLVIDAGGEIFDEYRRQQLLMKGQQGVGDRFMKWVHDHQWNDQKIDRIPITKSGESYDEFPEHAGLVQFDKDDRKFVAVANAHPEKPPILQATDSKWWGWKDALAEVGIEVVFLDPFYVEEKYREKMGA